MSFKYVVFCCICLSVPDTAVRPSTWCVCDASHLSCLYRSPIFIRANHQGMGDTGGWSASFKCSLLVVVGDSCWNLILTCTFQIPLTGTDSVFLNAFSA